MKKYCLILTLFCAAFSGFANDAKWNEEVLREADVQQIKKINHRDYDKIITLIQMGCLHKAQQLKDKLLKNIDSEKINITKQYEKAKRPFEDYDKVIFSFEAKREQINASVKSHEQSFLCNIVRRNKDYIEAILDLPSNKKENKKILINEIGKLSEYSEDNKNCIYFPLGDSKIECTRISLARIIKKIFEENNIKSKIIFTQGEKIKQITVTLYNLKKEIEYSGKEEITDTIEKIMLIYYENYLKKTKALNSSKTVEKNYRTR